jgi:hypothetical protein
VKRTVIARAGGRLLLALVTVGVSALVAPAASAAAPDHITGGCSYNARTISTDGVQVGVIAELSVTTTGDTPPMPIGATVTCWIEDDGVTVPGTTHSYGDVGGVLGVQAGADTVTFTAGPTDRVYECHSVVFADNTSLPADCPVDASPQFPPQFVLDAVDAVQSAISDAVCGVASLCTELCPALQSFAGNYGPFAISPEGDVYTLDPFALGTNPVIDCPPAEGSTS